MPRAVVGFVAPGDDAAAVRERARRRFSWAQPVVGGPQELVDHFGALGERGVERVYVWFTDFAPPESLLAFGESVVAQLAP